MGLAKKSLLGIIALLTVAFIFVAQSGPSGLVSVRTAANGGAISGPSNASNATTQSGGGGGGGCTPTVQLSGTDADGVIVPAGQCYAVNGLYNSFGNVIVYGTLVLRAGDTLRFSGINENNYTPGGNFSSANPPPVTQVGLFVLDDGMLDAQGTPKVGWNRTGDDPSWLVTDELRVAPIAAGEYGQNPFALWTKGQTPPQARADLPRAEVLNLTRDVIIEGTPTGRAHIYIKSSSAQIIKYITIQNLGPRTGGNKIVGRWPLHLHQNRPEGAPGYTIEGVVCRSSGSHCFVAHATDGITFRDNIAYDVVESPFWWDADVDSDASSAILWENNVAAKVNSLNNNEPRTAGFVLGAGVVNSNIARGNVAVGIHGAASDSNGYFWPGTGWIFENNVAHNNQYDGHSAWENTAELKTIVNMISYRNGVGNNQGAYNPDYIYQGGIFALNGQYGLEQHTVSTEGPGRDRSKYVGVRIEGIMYFCCHNIAPTGSPMLFLDITGNPTIVIDDGAGLEGGLYDFVACTADHAIETGDVSVLAIHPNSVYRVQRMNGTAFKVTSAGTVTIPAFYTC